MKTCPKCGFKDDPIWRNTLRRLYTEHCHIDDLKQWNPWLAEQLIKNKYVCLHGVKYRLNKAENHVHRIEAHLCKYPEPSNPRITEPDKEKHLKRFLGLKHGQKTL